MGKTASIRHFAEKNYESIIEINFVEEPKYKMITADGYRAAEIIKNISMLDPSKRFIPGKTLLFFDEMQDFPDISTALKFFSIDGRFDVICSGSMLGINYRQIESNSVGYKMDYEMASMDFEEFLWAKGYGDEFIQAMLDHMKNIEPFGDVQRSVCSTLFMDYCILGGMPAVVRRYIERGTFKGSLEMQRQLIGDYKEDVRKYAQGMDQTRILNVFNQIPSQLAKDNKKFQITKAAPGARFKDYRGCIEWFADSGLLVAMLDEEAQEDLRANRNLGVYKGALYENMVGEALVKSGCSLYYYKREDSTLEEDFFVRTAGELLPVEVKAKNGRAKSLRVPFKALFKDVEIIKGSHSGRRSRQITPQSPVSPKSQSQCAR